MRTTLCTSALALMLYGTFAGAADFEFSEDATGLSGEVSVWGGGTFPTNAMDEGIDCDGGMDEQCSDGLAFGGYANALMPLSGGGAIYGDLRYEWFEVQDSLDSDDGSLGVIGLHYISSGPDPWGVFALFGGGSNHADGDELGTIGGFGVEKSFGNFFLQAGSIESLDDSDDVDTLDDMLFVGGGSTHEMGNGRLETSLMIGAGDFDDGAEDNPGDWAQIGVTYFAPINDSGVEWFAGYRGDYLYVDAGIPTGNTVYHQTLSVGVNIPFGGAKSPFKTPNLTLPVVGSADFN